MQEKKQKKSCSAQQCTVFLQVERKGVGIKLNVLISYVVLGKEDGLKFEFFKFFKFF